MPATGAQKKTDRNKTNDDQNVAQRNGGNCYFPATVSGPWRRHQRHTATRTMPLFLSHLG
jgi:hypothetical protein